MSFVPLNEINKDAALLQLGVGVGGGGGISGQLRPTSFHTRRTRTQRYGPGAIVLAKNDSHCCPGLSLVPNIPEQPLPSFLLSFLPSFLPLLPFSGDAARCEAPHHDRTWPLFLRANGNCPPSPGGESESAGAGQMLAYRTATDPFAHVSHQQRPIKVETGQTVPGAIGSVAKKFPQASLPSAEDHRRRPPARLRTQTADFF